MAQKFYNPLEKGFRWVGDWYEYDGKPAEQAAIRERNADAARAKKEGRQVRKFSLGRQHLTKGGIGSGHPEIDLIVPVYGLEISEN